MVEAEVVALKLKNTFEKFELSAYPTYFAGIPKESLAALARANRRAELIQLATDGFLTFVVAADKAAVPLSRTTREAFLRRVIVQMKVEKRTFSQADIVQFAKEFSDEFDYGIRPLEFVQSFMDQGILAVDSEKVIFALPFIENYLLALECSHGPSLAAGYFQLNAMDVDLKTFDLYAEIGASKEIMKGVLDQVKASIDTLELAEGEKHILLTNKIHPAYLKERDQLAAMQRRLLSTASDVQEHRGDLAEKQKFLDLVDRVKDRTSKDSRLRAVTDRPETTDLDRALKNWSLGVTLLGSGAERLNGDQKKELIENLVELAALAIHHWTKLHHSIDFELIKAGLLEDDVIKTAPFYVEGKSDEMKKIVGGVIDLVEYGVLSGPFQRVMHYLCEHACNKVLIGSFERAATRGEFERFIHGAWFSDVDAKKGKEVLQPAIKRLPEVYFLRMNVASQLFMRVYWSHWNMADRLLLLDAATEALAALNMQLNKAELIRMVEKSEQDGPAAAE